MKLLVCVDTVEESSYLVKYATALAEDKNLSICYLNISYYPILIDATSQAMFDVKAFMDSQNQLLKSIVESHVNPDKNLDYSLKVEFGSFESVLVNELNQNPETILIMGATKASQLENKLFGSHFSEIANAIQNPIFIIPESVSYSPISKVIISYDGYTPLSDNLKNQLQIFSTLLKTVVEVFTVKRISDDELNSTLHRINHSVFDFLTSAKTIIESPNKVIDEISRKVSEEQFDLVVMLSKPHTWFDYLLSGSHTEELAEKINVPIVSFRV